MIAEKLALRWTQFALQALSDADKNATPHSVIAHAKKLAERNARQRARRNKETLVIVDSTDAFLALRNAAAAIAKAKVRA